MPFWALSLALHGAGLVLLVALVPLAAREPGRGGGVSLVLRAEGLCLGAETLEDVFDLECVETTPPLTTALWTPESDTLESDTLESDKAEQDAEVEDPFAALPPEPLEEPTAALESEPPFFLVPLEAARRRVPPAARRSSPVGTPPLTHPQQASASSTPPAAAPPQKTPSVRSTSTTASATTPRARPAAPAGVTRRTSPRGYGGGGQRGDRQPSLRIRYTPHVLDYYPRVARRRGHEGIVIVLMVIDARGTVIRATLSRSSGHTSLDAAALRIARAYRFVPPGAERRARLPIAFSLQSG